MKNSGKQLVWKEYQKEIADNHFFYARSCVRQNLFPGAEVVYLKILKDVLKKDIFEDANHTTCTGIGYHSDIIPMETTMTVIARQFALMTEAGYENMITSCVTSFGLYTEILDTWEHFPETLEKTRKNLLKATGRTFNIPKNLVHASDIIYKFRNEIEKASKYKLVNKTTQKPIRVVEHIGCHYSKMFPHKSIGGAEYPSVLIGMVETWGGEIIDYPERRHCCGFGFRQYLIQANRGYSIASTKKKFDSMAPYQPEMIITNCPGCPYFLDRWQYAIAEMEGKTYGENGYGIPVFTYEEVAALLLGFDPWEIGLQTHQVSAEPLLDKIGIPYNKTEKYKGFAGIDLGEPELPLMLKV